MGRMSLECTKNPCIAVGILYLYQFIYKLLEMPAAFLKVLVEAVACGGGAEYHAALCKPEAVLTASGRSFTRTLFTIGEVIISPIR